MRGPPTGGPLTLPGVAPFGLPVWCACFEKRAGEMPGAGVVRAAGYDVEDLYSAVIKLTSGAHGTVMLGWSLPPKTPGFGMAGVTVIGEHGVLRVTQGSTGVGAVDQEGPFDIDVFYAPEVHGRIRGALATEADHFVSCVRGDAEPLCDGSDGVEAVRVSLAMQASAESGAPVTCASM